MKTNSESYFKRFGAGERRIATPPVSDLALAVVIPCFNEPDLLLSLESLWQCQRPRAATEIIVVINAAENAPPEIIRQNERTLEIGMAWAARRNEPRFACHFIDAANLPPRQAGVGLARKIGMDEAVRRLGDVGRAEDGVIICFDADCRCDSNYLVAIESFFRAHPQSPACAVYFEHPLDEALDEENVEAIIRYELHLRFYIQALRFAGFPHAYHTVGSSMAVRAGAYQREGGMNKRQAGEDFYFLQKIIPLGNFGEVLDTRVLPSPRPSNRVPFGTGRAVRSFAERGSLPTYPWRAFLDLKSLFERVPQMQMDVAVAPHSAALETFLASQKFPEALAEIRANTAGEGAFQKRFFRWFDAFRVMKFIHHARDNFHGPGDLEREPRLLLGALGRSPEKTEAPSLRDLLLQFRKLDSAGASNIKTGG